MCISPTNERKKMSEELKTCRFDLGELKALVRTHIPDFDKATVIMGMISSNETCTDLASQKQPEVRDKDDCFSESGDNALEALNRVRGNASCGISSGDYEVMNPENYAVDMDQHFEDIQTIRTALEKGHRAQQIVDLMEQGNDIAFVSEHHGEFIYRTQKSPATLQNLDAFVVSIEEINKAGNIRTKAEFKRILKGGGFWLNIGNANKVVLTEDHLSENYTIIKRT